MAPGRGGPAPNSLTILADDDTMIPGRPGVTMSRYIDVRHMVLGVGYEVHDVRPNQARPLHRQARQHPTMVGEVEGNRVSRQIGWEHQRRARCVDEVSAI